MKKSWRYFFIGTSAVIAAFFVCAWRKARQKDDVIAESAADLAPPESTPVRRFDREYIEHRRELYRRRAAAWAACGGEA